MHAHIHIHIPTRKRTHTHTHTHKHTHTQTHIGNFMAEWSRTLGSQPRGLGFDLYSGRSRSATLGKLRLTLALSFRDVKPRSIACAPSNMGFKDPNAH